MMNIDRAHKELQDWFDDGCVGSLKIFRAPRSDYVDMIGEQTIKLKEMTRGTRENVFAVFNELDSEHVELFKDKHGNPDRAKIVRRY